MLLTCTENIIIYQFFHKYKITKNHLADNFCRDCITKDDNSFRPFQCRAFFTVFLKTSTKMVAFLFILRILAQKRLSRLITLEKTLQSKMS